MFSARKFRLVFSALLSLVLLLVAFLPLSNLQIFKSVNLQFFKSLNLKSLNLPSLLSPLPVHAGVVNFPGGVSENSTNLSQKYLQAAGTLTGLIQSTVTGTSYFTGGNVGIGTTGPTSLLHVKHPTGNLTTRFEGLSNSYSSKMYLSSVSSGDGGMMYDAATNLSNIFSYSDLRFNVGTANISGAIGNERMVIQQSGNVGIGTTGPVSGYKLDIAGDIILTDTTAKIRFGSNDGSYSTITHDSSVTDDFIITNTRASSGKIRFQTAGSSDRVTIQNDGNVGIGTTAPTSKLQVYDTTAGTRVTASALSSGSDYWMSLWSGANGNGTKLIWKDSSHLQLGTESTLGGTFSPWVTIQNNGNVGIGTTSPGAKLEINYGGRLCLGDVGHGTSWPGLANCSQLSTTGYALIQELTGAYTFINKNSTAGYIGFRVANVDKMVINESGNVGIGTTAPGTTLQVKPASYGESYGISLLSSTNSNVVGILQDNQDEGIFRLKTGGVDKVLLRANGNSYITGNVGIGTASPGAKLEVMGTIRTTGTFNGTWGAGEINLNSSDDTGNWRIFLAGTQYNPWGTARHMYFKYCTDASCASQYDAMRIIYTGGHADLAESIKSVEKTDKGDILSITDFTDRSTVKITNTAYDNNIIGVVSTRPGLIMDPDNTENGGVAIGAGPHNPLKPYLSLSGRVPVKISSLNGEIKEGNPITSSILRRYGMLATKAGRILGVALESFQPNDSKCKAVSATDQIIWPEDKGENEKKPCFKLPDGTYVGKIMVLTNISWYDPDVFLTATGELKIVGDNGNYSLKGKNGSTIDRVGAFAELIVAKVNTGLIETKKLIVDGVDILKKLNELSDKSDKQQQTIEAQQKQIEDMKKSIEDLKLRQ